MAEKESVVVLIQWQTGKRKKGVIEICNPHKGRLKYFNLVAFGEKYPQKFMKKLTTSEKYLRLSLPSLYIDKIIMDRTVWL